MCMEFAKACVCGTKNVSFHFRDNLLPTESIGRVYCPACSRDIKINPEAMVADNGWVIEYEMDVVRFSAHKLPRHIAERLSPEAIFDEDYATWRGVYPGDHIDSVKEREEIIKLAKTNPKEYMARMRDWANSRMDRLAKEGWRKALNAA